MIKLGELTRLGRRLRDGCSGKDCFASYAEAEREIGRMLHKGITRAHEGTLAPYACGFCHRWHLGHHRPRRDRK